MTLVGTNTESRLVAALESVIETTQDFTDSAYTTHDHRQHILMICEQLRHQLSVVLRIGASLVRTPLCFSLNTGFPRLLESPGIVFVKFQDLESPGK